MKTSKISESQVALALRQAEKGVGIGEIGRKLGIGVQTSDWWRKKCGRLMPSELIHFRKLEVENLRLKRLVANLALDKDVLGNGFCPGSIV